MNPKNVSDIKSKVAELKREGEERFTEQLASKLGYPYADLRILPVSTEALKTISESEAREGKIAPIEIKVKRLAIAVLNPNLPAARKIIENLKAKNYEVRVFIVSISSLEKVWGFYKFIKPEAEEITGKIAIHAEKVRELLGRLINFSAIQLELKNTEFSKTTPATVFEIILIGALVVGASDIHTEAEEKKAKLRLRVDGTLHDVFVNLPRDFYDKLVTHIKLFSGLKLNIHDLAQDGRFTITIGKKDIEIRTSVIPAEFGENVVMRILDPEVAAIGFESLGIRKDDMEIVERQIAKPNGLILNTGPTGSGKSTTLYAFLRKINNPEIKIITLEDPIEYRLEGVEQTQVDEESGYTFANGLRAVVRQDPDVILVGEIRDKDTADIAIQAALTGHLVLSTLHTNDALGAVPRLVHLGAKPETIGPALNLVIAQRLVRRICKYCKKTAKINPDMEKKIKFFLSKLPTRVDRKPYQTYKIYEVPGCDKCNNTGYKGRIGIFEFLEGGPELSEKILEGVSEVALMRLSEKQGMVTMQEDGVLKVLMGQTTLEEVEKVTGKIEWPRA